MKEVSPVYVQLKYDESVESKRLILSSEMSLLNLIKIIRRYQSLRLEELAIKSKLRKYAKELGTKTKVIQSSFPFLKIPKRIVGLELEERKTKETNEKLENDLEYQLKEIQKRLTAIGG